MKKQRLLQEGDELIGSRCRRCGYSLRQGDVITMADNGPYCDLCGSRQDNPGQAQVRCPGREGSSGQYYLCERAADLTPTWVPTPASISGFVTGVIPILGLDPDFLVGAVKARRTGILDSVNSWRYPKKRGQA